MRRTETPDTLVNRLTTTPSSTPTACGSFNVAGDRKGVNGAPSLYRPYRFNDDVPRSPVQPPNIHMLPPTAAQRQQTANGKLLLSTAYSHQLSFSRCHIPLSVVPPSPHLPYLSNGFESLQFARLFTHGVDVYAGLSPSDHILAIKMPEKNKFSDLLLEKSYGRDIHLDTEGYKMKSEKRPIKTHTDETTYEIFRRIIADEEEVSEILRVEELCARRESLACETQYLPARHS